ncbi:WD40-repeat-containing domain protein [Aspergillus crustosus]
MVAGSLSRRVISFGNLSHHNRNSTTSRNSLPQGCFAKPSLISKNVHPTDIFSLAVTDTQILSASGSNAIRVHSTTNPDFPLVQTLDAHKVGCHHVVTAAKGSLAVSVGFGGEVIIWESLDGSWSKTKDVALGDIWAVALSTDGRYLAATTQSGHIKAWNLNANEEEIRDHETKGGFGTCIDLSPDGRFIASGHENGSVFIFSTETGRMPFSLSGLVKPVRTVAFSPGGRYLAAAGDSRVIVLYDTSSGEQVASLTGHAAWILSLSWSETGEYLLSGSFDGKVKVWSIEMRNSVATLSETEKAVWSVRWLPKVGKSEGFATAGANRSISFYREATGG